MEDQRQGVRNLEYRSSGSYAHEGAQFVEINALIAATLYQDVTGIQSGSMLDFTFAHRGRNGDDTMKFSITDLGADNAIGGGDDTELYAYEYSSGNDEWSVYGTDDEMEIEAWGIPYASLTRRSLLPEEARDREICWMPRTLGSNGFPCNQLWQPPPWVLL